jgi:hypothetical protein
VVAICPFTTRTKRLLLPLSPLLLLQSLTMQEAKKLLEEKFKTGKNRWFFTKLRF